MGPKVPGLELGALEEAELVLVGTRLLGLQEGRHVHLGLSAGIRLGMVGRRAFLDGAAVIRDLLHQEALELGDLELEAADAVRLAGILTEVGGLPAGARQRQAGIEAGQGGGREAELVRGCQAGPGLILAALRGARLQTARAGELAVARQLAATALEA